MTKYFVDNRGERAAYDGKVFKDRVEYAKHIKERLGAGELTREQATKMLNEYGRKNKHWR